MSLFGGPPATTIESRPTSDDDLSPPSADDHIDDERLSTSVSLRSSPSPSFEPGAERAAFFDAKQADKWRRETRPYRDIYSALQRQENDDLAIHLFNAHVLRRRAHKPSKGDEHKCLDDEQSKLRTDREWAPRRKWTAWPLRLSDVPLQNERWGDEQHEEAQAEKLYDAKCKPSTELDEVMIAEAEKHARWCLSRTHEEPTQEQDSMFEEGLASSEGYEPNSMLDASHTAKVLQPLISHSVTKLERVLCALHRSQINHEVRASRKARSTHPAAGERSVSRKPLRPSSPVPRDWSEVLGTAQQLSWDGDVLSRVRSRCETLFSEKMLIQTLNEEDVLRTYSNKTAPNHATKDGVTPTIETSPLQEDGGLPRKSGWKCPEVTCTSAIKIFESREQWLEHIRAAHGYHYDGTETIVSLDQSPSKESDFCCPDPDCQRHTWPYSTRWRLAEHMKRSHGRTLEAKRPTPPSRKASASPDPHVSEDELHGGVHVDGFLQPIIARRGWRASSMSRSSSRTRPAKRTRSEDSTH